MTPNPGWSHTSANTRLYGLFGHPVSHSLSPAMHNAAFHALQLDARYVAFDVLPNRLQAAVEGALAMGFGGLNVTVPHKEGALALASEADPVASLVGAANTLVATTTGWKAYNTDADGFLRAVEVDLGFCPRGRRCLLLGAGGGARAAAVALVRKGAQEILVANRNRERAEKLCADLSGKMSGAPLRAVATDQAPRAIGPGDLLVSATPLGLRPDGRWPWDLGRFDRGVAVYDMAYVADGETALVNSARAAGLGAASGRSMLVHQGAAAFTLWTGLPPPGAVMGDALVQATAGSRSPAKG